MSYRTREHRLIRLPQMKIVCLVKQVPRADAIEFDPETKSLRREGVTLLLNPFDAAAVVRGDRAQRLNGGGGEVIAMTMGPPQAADALRTCLALGADRCIHLSDRRVCGCRHARARRARSRWRSRRSGDVDLVLCGRKTLDSETWQVPPETAAFLGWPHLTSVTETKLESGRLRATRETELGYDTYELDGPAVLSLAHTHEGGGERDGTIDVWTASDLVDDLRDNDKRFGQTGSPTRVLAVRDVTPERKRIETDDPTDVAARVRELLAERALEPSQWEKPDRLGERPGKNYDAWTLVELVDGQPSRASLELVGKGRELARKARRRATWPSCSGTASRPSQQSSAAAAPSESSSSTTNGSTATTRTSGVPRSSRCSRTQTSTCARDPGDRERPRPRATRRGRARARHDR